MAVKDESLHRATESLILPAPRTYYRANIHASHWQLRSVISSPEQDVVYYPNGSDVYALYTRTREREIVTRLPFSPRCLVASNGWLCCGGEPGHYTAIPLNDWNTDLDFSISLDADPDARLPLDLDPARRSTPRDISSVSRRSRAHNHPLLAHVKCVGKEINNCITLWFPSPNLSERVYDCPVAVISNNDKTISIVNLEDPEAEVLEKLAYPDCVNRAVISPDGELLVAILDDPFLYVHQRKPAPKVLARNPERAYEWSLVCRLQLESQKQSDQSILRGSFAASFSKSGKYLAVGTQYGIISIFDTETLMQEDSKPLVIFTTSRPMQSDGAVRSMEFSPGPFDLLAWTEASGRAGVADVRDLFISRQLLMVDCRLDGIERVSVSERSADPVIDPRLRSFRSLRAESPGNSTPDYLSLDFERRQLRNLTQEVLERHHSPLTPEEMDILQAHRIARRYRDAEAEGSDPPNWSPWTGEPRTSTTESPANGEGSSSSERRISTTGLPAALRDFVNPDRATSSSFRSFINERNQDRERRNLLELRRDHSTAEGRAEGGTRRESQTLTLVDTSNDIERLTITPPPPPQPPWAEFAALARARSPQLPTSAQSSRLAQRQEERRQVEERRQTGERRYSHRPRPRQTWRGIDDMGLGNFDENVILRGVLRTGPANTMGCCWSPDGRILYVGAEDGVYEYHVNTAGRKKFPSVVLR